MASNPADPLPAWREIDWRRHLHRVKLTGAEVVFAELGEGEPVLFVHGLGGSWRNWLENLPHFGRDHRALALDLPGFGESPMPEWPIDLPAYGRLVSEFCEALGIDRLAALVGNSLGGFVATEAVLGDQKRFERLVLVDAAGLSLVDASRRQVEAVAKALRLTGARLAARDPPGSRGRGGGASPSAGWSTNRSGWRRSCCASRSSPG